MGTETPRGNSQHSFNRIDSASTLDFAVTKEDVPVRTYGGRVGYTPRAPAQFGDGGAFPEIHLIQYPRCFHLEKLSTDPYLEKTNSAEATPSVGETGENKSRNTLVVSTSRSLPPGTKMSIQTRFLLTSHS